MQAQKASRASVEIYTNRYLKGKILDRDAYVIRVMKNGFTAMIPEFGVEGFVYTTQASVSSSASANVKLEYDEESNSLIGNDIAIKVFDKVKVRITIEDGDTTGRRAKMVLGLLEPVIPGMSISHSSVGGASPSVGSGGKRSSALERPSKKLK